MITLADVQAARGRIRAAIYESPCAFSEALSRLCGCRVALKLENLQMTGSFKERGALNRLLLLDEAERARGVITASAGNHGQSLAYHCGRLGLRATIVMPERTPLIKIDSTRSHGAEVVLFGANYDEAAGHARALEAERGAVYVHPFDDEGVVAGQGTIGLEIAEQVPDADVVVTAVGGGGLAGGTALALKESGRPVRVYGVQTARVPSLRAALASGAPVTVPPAVTLADGIAVRRVGAAPLPIVQRYLDGVLEVDEEEIASAILLLLEKEKTVAEGAGAAPLAALVGGLVPDVAGKRVVLVLSGGNIDVTLMSRIIERGLVKTGRLLRLRVCVPDVAGALARLAELVAEHGANVLQVLHQRAFGVKLGQAELELELETRGLDHIAQIEAALRARGYEVSVER